MDSIFNGYGFVSKGLLCLSPREAFELCNRGAVLVDTREEVITRFKKFKVPQIAYLPLSKLKEDYSFLSMEGNFIAADSSGVHSRELALFLKEKEYQNVAVLAGGMVEWERDGLPINLNLGEQLSGSCVCQLRFRNT